MVGNQWYYVYLVVITGAVSYNLKSLSLGLNAPRQPTRITFLCEGNKDTETTWAAPVLCLPVNTWDKVKQTWGLDLKTGQWWVSQNNTRVTVIIENNSLLNVWFVASLKNLFCASGMQWAAAAWIPGGGQGFERTLGGG